MYYNPIKHKKISHERLKEELHCSFSDKTEEIHGWYSLHNGEKPEIIPGQTIAPGAVELIDGHYVQTYVAIGSLEACKAAKLEVLNKAWLLAEENGVVTVDGITIDATSRSNRDIEGLITSLEAQGVANTVFCDANNNFHEVTLQQLKDFRLAVIGLGQRLYAQKWRFRTEIQEAETIEELAAIEISFEGV